MRFFMVAFEEHDGDSKQLMARLDKDRFPDVFEYLQSHVWLVRATSPTDTSSDIVDALIAAAAEEDRDQETQRMPLMLVVKSEAFDGIAESRVWEKLDAWTAVSS